MAMLNNLYVTVTDENVDYNTESSSHPIETGSEITDHLQKKPVTVSLRGYITNVTEKDETTGEDVIIQKASDILSNLLKLQTSGSLIYYVGRNTQTNLQIQSFSTSHPNTVWGGCQFSMSLKEIKIAQKASVEQGTSTQQVDKGENQNVYHIVKKGDCIWNLVTKTYKSLEPKYSKVMDKCNWVMSQNPNAFSRKGDFRTLQIGKKILIGYRK